MTEHWIGSCVRVRVWVLQERAQADKAVLGPGDRLPQALETSVQERLEGGSQTPRGRGEAQANTRAVLSPGPKEPPK